jgi:hypothetical protein
MKPSRRAALALFASLAAACGATAAWAQDKHPSNQPGKIAIASAGNGTLNHLIGEMLGKAAVIELMHVPYKEDPPKWARIVKDSGATVA